jgi:hypothetical protein
MVKSLVPAIQPIWLDPSHIPQLSESPSFWIYTFQHREGHIQQHRHGTLVHTFTFKVSVKQVHLCAMPMLLYVSFPMLKCVYPKTGTFRKLGNVGGIQSYRLDCRDIHSQSNFCNDWGPTRKHREMSLTQFITKTSPTHETTSYIPKRSSKSKVRSIGTTGRQGQ